MRYYWVLFLAIALILFSCAESRSRKKCPKCQERRRGHKAGRSEKTGHRHANARERNLNTTTITNGNVSASTTKPSYSSQLPISAMDRFKALLGSPKSRPGPSMPMVSKHKADKWTEAIVDIQLDLGVNHNITEKPKSIRIPVRKTIGKFGYHSTHDSVSGKVIHVVDVGTPITHFGCSGDMANKGEISTKEEPWIALISRGKCRFADKIRLAEKHGASAVVIYDNDPSGNVEVMSTLGTNIISLMISVNDGTRVAELINTGHAMFMDVSVGKTHIRGSEGNTETASQENTTTPCNGSRATGPHIFTPLLLLLLVRLATFWRI